MFGKVEFKMGVAKGEQWGSGLLYSEGEREYQYGTERIDGNDHDGKQKWDQPQVLLRAQVRYRVLFYVDHDGSNGPKSNGHATEAPAQRLQRQLGLL